MSSNRRSVYEADLAIALQAGDLHHSLELLPRRTEIDEYGEPIPTTSTGGYGLGEVVRVMHNCLPV